MILSWLFCRIPSLSQCFSSGSVHHPHYDGEAPSPPPLENECWKILEDSNSEAQYRYSLGQGSTLDNDLKNDIYDALYALVHYHGLTVERVHAGIRERRLSYLWLYSLPHPGATDPECVTTCRDALTRETRAYSVGVFLGPESEYILVRQATRGSALNECGFLELK